LHARSIGYPKIPVLIAGNATDFPCNEASIKEFK
jgi:hypothetical protein